MRLTDRERLEIIVYATQNRIPSAVPFRGKEYTLTRKDTLAVGRAIWYVFVLGFGLSSAREKTRQEFKGTKAAIIKRALNAALPEGYSKSLEVAKRKAFMKRMNLANGQEGKGGST
jgi:hypothetical protein